MADIACTRFTDRKIYIISAAAWAEFAIQPAGGVGDAIWGGPGDSIWSHNGYYTGDPGGTPKYLLFDGTATWTEHTSPTTATGLIPRDMHGSLNGAYVYAGGHAFSGSGFVHRFSGGSWTEMVTGWRAGSIWCDETGQHVWAAPGSGDRRGYIYHSTDYGVTWSNIVPQLLSDTGDSGIQFGTCSVWGRGINDVYITYGWANRGRIAKWNGSVWSIVSLDNSAFSTRTQNGAWLVATDTELICLMGTDERNCGRDVSGSLTVTYWNNPVLRRECNGRSIIENRQDGKVYAAFEGIGANNSRTIVSSDGGGTWALVTEPWAPAQQGVSCLTEINYVIGTPPYLQNQSPAPGSSGNSAGTSVYVEVVDDEGNLDISTVDIRINGVLAWTSDSVVQPGYSGFKVPVTNGYGYTISLWEEFNPGLQSIRVVADDLTPNSLDETYTFSTDPVSGICTKVQWGDFIWGDVQWGQCETVSVSVVAINEYTVRVYYRTTVKQTNSEDEDDALNPKNYSIEGGFRKLEVLNVSSVDSSTVDLTVLEMTDGATYTLEISESISAILAGFYDYTGIGVPPFVIAVENSTAGILEVRFVEAMLNDISFRRPSSYIITPQGDASPIFVTGVVVDPDDTTKVTLSFIGGGSTYILSTPGLMDLAGNYCNPPDFLFKILFPTVDELDPTQKLYLDTDMGSMALGISELTQRRVEDLAILRARNEGHLRQFSLIADELERSGIDRDDRKLKLFKG